MNDEIRIPGYEILELVGKGGMSSVYRARQENLDRIVAIKVLSSELVDTGSFQKRFTHEAISLAHLSHPNILAVYDVGAYKQIHYIATEYLPGDHLGKKIKEGIEPALAISIAKALAEALGYANSMGVVHRDIKPGNVLFRPEGTPVLVDFGIARASKNMELTQVGSAIGSPQYMSPEQARGDAVDGRSDLYSLGIVLYEMLTGELPFDNEDPFSIALMHINDPVPRLPQEFKIFQPLLDGLLEKSVEDRFDSAVDVVSQLVKVDNDISHVAVAQGNSQVAARSMSVAKSSSIIGSLFGRLFSGLARRSSASPVSAPKKTAFPPQAVNKLESESASSPEKHASGNWWEKGDDAGPAGTVLFRIDDDLVQKKDTPDPAAEPEESWEATRIFQVQGSAVGDIPVVLKVIESVDPGLEGRCLDINKSSFVVGRGQQADLCLEGDISISREHFRIEHSGGGFHIVDLSTNGMFVNGRRLVRDKPEPLLFGDTILLSKSTSLKFSASIEALPDLTGTVLDNRYNLTKQIHSSIKASTFIARDRKMSRNVVIKIFSPSLAKIPHYARIFRQQGEVAVQLGHPFIAKVWESSAASVDIKGHREEAQYLCMEEMSAGNLSDKVPYGSPLDLQQAMEWLTKIADALSYAHEEGFVHGGLKPSAIVFDHQGNPYVADFAMAGHKGTEAGSAIFGSAAFIAPEQWDNGALTPATDQYSLAVLVYLMLSGGLPFVEQGNPEVRRQNYLRPFIPVHEEAAHNGQENLPPALSIVLEKALSTSPDARYESVKEFFSALVEGASGKQKNAKPSVFISYQRGTSAGWAMLFRHNLEEKYEIDTYVDTQAVDQAAHFPERLANAIADCDMVICLLGEKTLESKWVREEIRIAHEHGKPMVPVFQEGFKHPLQDEDLPLFLRSLLSFDAVHLLDERAIYVDPCIEKIARIVHTTYRSGRN
jgi:serine/threonine protein kinase